MDTDEFKEKLDDLSANVDDLEEALAPLLKQDLTDTTSKLPLLDKAKLNVLSTYAIESLLFSILKLHGTDAKAHPVFTELSRVKQYFQKIEAAEAKTQGSSGPNVSLDKAAANRFIKHALAGNERNAGNAHPRQNTKITFTDNDTATASPKPTQSPRTITPRANHGKTSANSSSSSSSTSSDSDSAPETHPATEASKEKSAAQTPQMNQQAPPRPIANVAKRKKKSDTAPRDGAEVFQDLLNRPQKKAKKSGD